MKTIATITLTLLFAFASYAQMSTAQVRRSLYGNTVSSLDGRPIWTFQRNELIELDIDSSYRNGTSNIVNVSIRTGDAPGFVVIANGEYQPYTTLEGQMRLTFQRGRLVKIENISVAPMRLPVKPETRTNAQTIPQISANNGTSPLINNTFHVSNGGWYNFPFTVSRRTNINGTFVAQGGGRSNIEGLVMTQAEYLNWKNNNSSLTYYRSQPVTYGEVNIILDPGQYVMVFYNADLLNAKTVSATIYAK